MELECTQLTILLCILAKQKAVQGKQRAKVRDIRCIFVKEKKMTEFAQCWDAFHCRTRKRVMMGRR